MWQARRHEQKIPGRKINNLIADFKFSCPVNDNVSFVAVMRALMIDDYPLINLNNKAAMGKKDTEMRAVFAAVGLFSADCPLCLNIIKMLSLGHHRPHCWNRFAKDDHKIMGLMMD